MAADPYAHCPCGSGKKLKFCCGDILPELQRAIRIRDNQPEGALRVFRDLHRRHPDKEVVLRELVALLLDLDEGNEAREIATEFLRRYPDQPVGLLTLASVQLHEDGFAQSRRALHRAFQICSRSQQVGVSFLAAQVAVEMSRIGQWMSAREHLAMAVRFSTGERQRMLLLELIRFESQPRVPLLLRCSWNLLPLGADEEIAAQEARARKLSQLGCWEPAAILFNRLLDKYPTSGAIWFNLGLCQAWDARVADAASSLHHAATVLSDSDLATEAEALAQELDLLTTKDRHATVSVELRVKSLSELLTRIEQEPRIVRTDSHDHSECDHGDDVIHVGEFVLLTKPCTAESLQTPDDLAESIADIDLFDVTETDDDDGQPSGPYLEITSSDRQLDQAIVTLRDLAGDLILTSGSEEERMVVATAPDFELPFDRNLYRPAGVKPRRFSELSAGVEGQAIDEWLNRPTFLLNGKSPLEASQDPELRTKLAASLLVLEARSIEYGFAPDLSQLRSRLNLPAPAKISLSDATPIAAVPVVQYERIDLSSLTDSQVSELANRCSMIGLQRRAKSALEEVTRRPGAISDFGARRAWLMLSAIARHDMRADDAIELLRKAREASEAGDDAFRNVLEVDVRELTYRLDDPVDSDLIPLLHRFRDRYLHKIPDIEGVISEQLERSGCGHLLSELTGGGVMATASASSTGLWTPGDSTSEPAAAGGGLWLPGQ